MAEDLEHQDSYPAGVRPEDLQRAGPRDQADVGLAFVALPGREGRQPGLPGRVDLVGPDL